MASLLGLSRRPGVVRRGSRMYGEIKTPQYDLATVFQTDRPNNTAKLKSQNKPGIGAAGKAIAYSTRRAPSVEADSSSSGSDVVVCFIGSLKITLT